MKKVELGCGPKKKDPSSIGVDVQRFNGVDIVADLNLGMPFFEDNSIDEIYSSHFLEHINDLSSLMQEAYRVLKPGGIFKGKVPHYANPYFYSDPTHHQFLGLYTFSYFEKTTKRFTRGVPNFYNDVDFEILDIKLIFKSFSERNKTRTYIKNIIESFVNKTVYRQELYEEMFVWLITPYEINFELRKYA